VLNELISLHFRHTFNRHLFHAGRQSFVWSIHCRSVGHTWLCL